MKQVSISRNTLAKMTEHINIYPTVEECQAIVDICGCGVVAEAYEMEGEHGYEKLAYNTFRGYVVNW